MSRAKNRLTVKQIAAASKPGYLADGGGLYLRVKSATAKSWVIVSTKGGKRVEKGIGSVADLTLASARDRRDNPPAEAGEGVPLFGAWADEWLNSTKENWKNETDWLQWSKAVRVYTKPLAAMLVDAIKIDDVKSALAPIWQEKAPTASRIRGNIERILDAAKVSGHISDPWTNPARWKGVLEHLMPKQSKTKNRRGHLKAIHWSEMPAFWTKLAARPRTSSAMGLMLTILGVPRTHELTPARRKEVDLDASLWTIPGERMKGDGSRADHVVVLSSQATALFRELCEGLGPDDCLFSARGEVEHMSDSAMLQLLKQLMGYDATVHGTSRSSFTDWVGEFTDYNEDLAELALAHDIRSKVKKAYRREQSIAKRRPLMQDWADYLEGKPISRPALVE
jgi:integrase